MKCVCTQSLIKYSSFSYATEVHSFYEYKNLFFFFLMKLRNAIDTTSMFPFFIWIKFVDVDRIDCWMGKNNFLISKSSKKNTRALQRVQIYFLLADPIEKLSQILRIWVSDMIICIENTYSVLLRAYEDYDMSNNIYFHTLFNGAWIPRITI